MTLEPHASLLERLLDDREARPLRHLRLTFESAHRRGVDTCSGREVGLGPSQETSRPSALSRRYGIFHQRSDSPLLITNYVTYHDRCGMRVQRVMMGEGMGAMEIAG